MKSEGRVRVNTVDWLSLILVIVGGINWGLVGIGNFLNTNLNLVNLLFGSIPALENLIYVLVGLAALYELYFAYKLYGAHQTREQPRGTAE